MSGQLFTQYFLTDGIRGTQEWAAAASNCEVFCQNLASLWESFKTR